MNRIIYAVMTVLLINLSEMSYSQININQLSDAEKIKFMENEDYGSKSNENSADSINNQNKTELTNIISNTKSEIAVDISESKINSPIDTDYIADKWNGLPHRIELPHIDSNKIFRDFGFAGGLNLSYYPVIDTTFIAPGIYKSYWVNISETIYGLPFQIGAASGDGISYSEEVVKSPFQFNLNFDYDQCLANTKQKLIEGFEAKKDEEFEKYEQINFTDSLAAYNLLKDTLANADYLSFVNQMMQKKEAILDSIKNCFEVDTSALQQIDSALAKYNQIRAGFNRLISFQNKYYEIKSKYDDYISQFDAVKESIESKADLTGLLNSANQFGLKADFPKWPLNFKKFQIGAQFVNFTPLTFQNYVSNGISIEYNADQLIVKADALTQNWFSGSTLATDGDSIVNLFQNNQTAYITGIGFGNPDSNHILFTTAYTREKLPTEVSDTRISNLLLSFYQKTHVVKDLFFEYEVAKSQNFETPEYIEADSSTSNAFLNQCALYGQFTYLISRTKTELSIDESLIGLSYVSLGNPFIKSGTINSGAGIKQSLLKAKLNLSYKLTISNTVAANLENINTYYHIGQLDYQFSKIGSFHFMLSPYQYNYSIEDVLGAENSGSSNFINCFMVLNIPIKKSNLSSVITYSNFSTQNNFLDTIYFLKTNSVSANMMATVKGRIFSADGVYFIPNDDENIYLVNTAELKATIFDNSILYMDCGPKWLGYEAYNDQFGGGVNLIANIGKFLNWSIALDKYFEIEHTKEKFYSDIFFNTSMSITLN